MHVSQLRTALFAGASLTSIGLVASPAQAATVAGVCQDQTNPSVTQTLDITLVGDTGVTDNTDPATAIVNNCATGRIHQGANATGVPPAGDVNQTIFNGVAGDVDVVAQAIAVDNAGNATAY